VLGRVWRVRVTDFSLLLLVIFAKYQPQRHRGTKAEQRRAI
jgi:hypothetical protein